MWFFRANDFVIGIITLIILYSIHSRILFAIEFRTDTLGRKQTEQKMYTNTMEYSSRLVLGFRKREHKYYCGRGQ